MGKTLKILVIDDDEVDRRNIIRTMKKTTLNVEVAEVSTSNAGIQAMNRENFDCILLDYQLPDGDGIQLLQKMLLSGGIKVPVIFMTGLGNELLAVQAIKSGASDYIPKEKITSEGLSSSIERAIRFHKLSLRAKNSEQRLVERETRYRTIVETVSDLIFQLDPDRNITYINSAIRLMGYEPAEVTGRPIEEFIDCDDKEQVLTQISTQAVGPLGTNNLEVVFRTNPESVLWEEVRTTTVLLDAFGLWDIPPEEVLKDKASKAFLGTLCICRNITEIKKTEDQSKKFAAELKRSNQELEKFSYVVSHDLQEPLRKIIIFGDRLLTEADNKDEQEKNYLEKIQNAAGRMNVLIDTLLQYSRVTTKKLPFELVDLKQTLTGVLSDLEIRLEQTGGTVNINDLPHLEADPLQMRQLFQNLIGNALKYHRKEAPPVVNVHCRSAGKGSWEITIEDNGIGFDDKHSEQIFKPFERLHNKNTYEGTGIGLSICKKIIDRHHGTITAKSVPQQGTTLTITLPAKQPKETRPSQ